MKRLKNTKDVENAERISKVELICQMIERRVHHGVYIGRDLPAERDLAVDIGVSRMTARKALQRLVDTGTLERMPNGRVGVRKTKGLQITMLVPSVASTEIEGYRMALEGIARKKRVTVHTRLYLHWDDPLIVEALEGCGGVFLVSSCEPMPPRLMERFRTSGKRMVSLGFDLTAFGIPSLDLLPPHALQKILDYLATRGHRRIDCFNTQTCDPIIEARLAQWRLWLASHGIEGKLWNFPIQPYENPLVRAHAEMAALMKTERFSNSAILCTTMYAAIGAVRALRDGAVSLEKDHLDIAAFSDEQIGHFLSPSITALKTPTLMPYLAVCVDWMMNTKSPWIGPLLVRDADPTLFIGETTGG